MIEPRGKRLDECSRDRARVTISLLWLGTPHGGLPRPALRNRRPRTIQSRADVCAADFWGEKTRKPTYDVQAFGFRTRRRGTRLSVADSCCRGAARFLVCRVCGSGGRLFRIRIGDNHESEHADQRGCAIRIRLCDMRPDSGTSLVA
jgi:hypothetical protein